MSNAGGKSNGRYSMMRTMMVTLVVFFFMLAITYASDENNHSKRATPDPMKTLLSKISDIEKRCIISLRGLDCPGSVNDQFAKTSLRGVKQNLPIVGGVGYSRMDKSIKPQILQSPPASVISAESSVTIQMSSAAEYINMLYPNSSSTIFSGIFSHGYTNADLIFSNYFNGNMSIWNTQKHYFTHNAEITTIQVTPDFQQIIDILPNSIDLDMYNQVLESFGDSIATKIKYGGLVDLTVSIKSCFSDPNMKKYLENQLQASLGISTTAVPSGYLKYNRVDSLDIIGGNPEVVDITTRVKTFASNPVPIMYETIPIWRAFPPGPKQENMKTAYNNFQSSSAKYLSSIISSVEAAKQEEKRQVQQFHVYKVGKDGKISKVELVSKNNLLAVGESRKVDLRIGNSNSKYVQKGLYLIPTLTSMYDLYPIVHRIDPTTFNFDFEYCSYDIYSTQIVCLPVTKPPYQYTSPIGKDNCVRFNLPSVDDVKARNLFYYSENAVIVCSGCSPLVSQDATSISCQCPYVN